MTDAEEFILIPKSMYIKDQPVVSQVLDDPQMKNLSAQFSLLNRYRGGGGGETPSKESKSSQQIETDYNYNNKLEKNQYDEIIRQISFLESGKLSRAKIILNAINQSPRLQVNEQQRFMLDGQPTGVSVAEFLYNTQQPTKKLTSDYPKILSALNIGQHLVINTNAKRYLGTTSATVSTPKNSGDKTKVQSPKKYSLRKKGNTNKIPLRTDTDQEVSENKLKRKPSRNIGADENLLAEKEEEGEASTEEEFGETEFENEQTAQAYQTPWDSFDD